MSIQLSQVFAIAPHHRFQWEEAQESFVILFPEGMVKLNQGAGEILSLVNGQHSVQQIIDALKAKFPGADDIDGDILSMLELALSKGWLSEVAQ
jgi:pyrroloquinoline quinone biosynthesis protein D